jgi:DNA-binding winged helix-turn-helix (wHTH) protein/predicted ATPase
MSKVESVRFGPYRLDPAEGRVWRGDKVVRLTAKTFSVLQYLAEHSGRLVTKAELFKALWPATVVSDAALTRCVRELREALADDPRKPHYVETVHRRGFRFIGKVVSDQLPVVGPSPSAPPRSRGATRNWQLTTPLVGRDTELTRLHGWFEKALRGERQVVFVTGEPGIGKTTLVEAFRRRLEAGDWRLASSPRASSLKSHASPVWLVHGQCIEHYGAGEAYLPVLEALGQLCREPGGGSLIKLLSQYAPTWLVQMPALLSPDEIEALQRKTAGATRERMLRELTEALEILTEERPVILWLEDLHWSDVSTLDLLSALARRHERARLLLLGSYRPIEVLSREHPLKGMKQELQMHGQCEELALDFLSEAAVAEYLVQRFDGVALQPGPVRQLARVIHRRTDGSPLFMVNVVNDLMAQGVVVKTNGQWGIRNEVKELTSGTPTNLRQMIEEQLARVSVDEREVLEAASVAGAEFSAAAVAAAAEQSTEAVEARCDALVRHEQFLRARGTSEWPDGTIAARYGFIHALYQEVLYERLAVSRRSRLHRQIGERLEQGYGDQTGEIAAELAIHFERGRDYQRAVRYHERAGQRASLRGANTEAVSHVTTGLQLLKTWPDTPERTRQELTLRLTLGTLSIATHGFASPEVDHAFRRARELCQQTSEREHVVLVLLGMVHYHAMRAEHQTARELAEELFRVAQEAQDPELLIEAHYLQGNTLEWTGEYRAALTHLEESIALYDPHRHRSHALRYGSDPGVACRVHAMQILWLLGYPDRALMRAQEALALAEDFFHPNSVAYGLIGMAQIHHHRREWPAAQARGEALLAFSTEFGLPYFVAQGSIVLGAALAGQGHYAEGIAKMRQGLAAQRATGGQGLLQHWLIMQLEAYIETGQFEEGRNVLEEALTIRPQYGDRYWEEEVYRLNGELLLAEARRNAEAESGQKRAAMEAEAEACFRRAIATAREQKTKSLELRAATSLARLWQRRGKEKQASKMLAEIYNWFTEGFDTKDLQEAKALLDELMH